MANTVQDVCLSILAATASDAGLQLAGRWLNERYTEFLSRARTQQLRHYGSLFVPAPITTGTVSIVQGSATVTLTNAVTSAQKGWVIRFSQVWYVVIGIDVTGTILTLDSAVSDTTNATSTYQLVQRFIPVDPNTRWVSDVMHPRLRHRLKNVTQVELNSRAPSRELVSAEPFAWSEVARFVESTNISTSLGTTNQKLIEVYPPSTQIETYVYSYWTVPTTLLLTDNLPPEIDQYVLREGVLVDVYRYKSETFANKADSLMAEFYANKESRQRTIWEQVIQQAQVADAAFHNQMTVRISSYGGDDLYDFDITNAHDWTVSGWTQ